MTANRDLKRIIRERQAKTGESYTASRAQILGDRPKPEAASGPPVEAVVLKVNRQSLRVRVLGEEGTVTFRSGDAADVVPGHLVTLALEKRWTWRDDAYATGRIDGPRVAVDRIGLTPLPLHGGERENLRDSSEPFRAPDPYAPLWRRLTASRRRGFEFDGIAWGALPGLASDDLASDDHLIGDAVELERTGDGQGAREALMNILCADLRCIDAPVHLGHLVFDERPERAMVHYEIGVGIGELSLGPDFDGVLEWGRLYNRPFLRGLHALGLCRWRLGDFAAARSTFERILSLNPGDNQGVRFCHQAVLRGETWEAFRGQEMAVWN
jgi:hypothetical protein